LILAAAVVVLALGACTACIGAAVIGNNLELAKAERALYGFPLPRDSAVLNRRAVVALLGNGNHCDYQVKQLVETPLSSADVLDHYRTFDVAVLQSTLDDRPVVILVNKVSGPDDSGINQIEVTLVAHGEILRGLDLFDPRCT
jgi:hypothetical protein